jgi:hypothetical protein
MNVVYGQNVSYSYSDVHGIWVVEYNMKSKDSPWVFGNEFLIFKEDNFIVIATHNDVCMLCASDNRLCVRKYGFTDSCFESEINELGFCGKYLSFLDEKNNVWSWGPFYVHPKQELFFFNNECVYLINLPKKAQTVLYLRSIHDHRNYAREFLEYDICGVKADSVQLLDSLQNPTNTIIYKDDIVVVRDTTGNLLQVEYEPEPDKYVVGYLRREDLQFVCSE